MNYSVKLKDPRWQKKRLEVLERAGWKCEECGENNETLHVHHCWYEKNKEPWEYRENCLKCLCESCHQTRQEDEMFIRMALSNLNKKSLQTLLSTLLYNNKFCEKLKKGDYK